MKQILDRESERWSSMAVDQLLNELREERNYQLRSGSQEYQFEVQLLENKPTYLLVAVAVDDGRLPFLGLSMTTTFIRDKVQPNPV